MHLCGVAYIYLKTDKVHNLNSPYINFKLLQRTKKRCKSISNFEDLITPARNTSFKLSTYLASAMAVLLS